MNENNGEPRGILCGKGHRHASVNDVKACYESDARANVTWDNPSGRVPVAPRPPAMPTSGPGMPSVGTGDGRRVVHTSAAPTEAQRATAKRLGGTIPEGVTRLRASEIIDSLMNAHEERERRLAEDGGRVETVEEERAMHKTSLGIPAEMLFAIKEGRYAVSLDGSKRLEFVRLSQVKPKAGKFVKYAGCLRVQTQHGDMLKDRAVIAPNGTVHLVSNTMSAERLTQIFMGIIVDQRAAAIRYGREKGQCMRCGKQLTDERSRHYGIGPECEKHYPEIIYELDEQEGAYVPSLPMSEV